MRRHVLAFCLPLIVAACDQSPNPPAQQAEAQTPAVEAPEAAESAPTPAPDADAAPLFGIWAADLSWCSGEGEGFPITISETRFEGRENSCDITALEDNGDGSFTASLSCQSEGETITEKVAMTPIFGPTGEGIRLEYLDRGGDPVTVFRCKGTATSPAQDQ